MQRIAGWIVIVIGTLSSDDQVGSWGVLMTLLREVFILGGEVRKPLFDGGYSGARSVGQCCSCASRWLYVVCFSMLSCLAVVSLAPILEKSQWYLLRALTSGQALR